MKLKLIGYILSLVLIASMSVDVSAVAATASISKSYNVSTQITSGSLVSLSQNKTNYIVSANTQNADSLIGVAEPSNGSVLAIDNNSSTHQEEVALSGTTNVLVSTLNGPISVGDEISVSPINGVGMKAVTGYRVIGIAQTGFSSSSSDGTTRQIKNTQGQYKKVDVGYISVSIAIGTGSVQASDKTPASGFLRLVQSVTGHQVSLWAAILSTLIAFLALASLVTLIYGTIRGSLISIGRNPLARPAIFESLAQVLAMAVLIVVVAVLVIYLILY